MAKKKKKQLTVLLRSGEKLQIKKLGPSGYITAPIGAIFLGGTPSRGVVGKFCLGVVYEDGQTGIIAQEEIAEIVTRKGKPLDWGNPKYPGHPGFDPRQGFDPFQEQIEVLRQVSASKERSRKIVEKEGLAAAIEKDLQKYDLSKKKKRKKK